MHNYQEIKQKLEIKGKQLFGNHFKFYQEDEQVINSIIVYFLKDVENANRFQINLSKGMLLSGPIGCGKTSLMELMRVLAISTEKYYLKPCRDVSFEFIQEGYEVIHRYSKGGKHHQKPTNICFDDLGVENNLKYFGNECNVMGEIILSRYDLSLHSNQNKRVITHMTTNFSATEIESQYGNRVRSRMREQFNLLAFKNGSRDKRR